MIPARGRLTFVEAPVPDVANKPSVGMVSQSGAVAVVPGAMRMAKDVGIMASVSTGNETTSARADRVEQLPGDPQTSAIAMIEQFRQPPRFLARRTRKRGGQACRPASSRHVACRARTCGNRYRGDGRQLAADKDEGRTAGHGAGR